MNGNYRTSLVGQDLNRVWHKPDHEKHPEIFYFKRFVANLSKRATIEVYADFHGHSKKKGLSIAPPHLVLVIDTLSVGLTRLQWKAYC